MRRWIETAIAALALNCAAIPLAAAPPPPSVAGERIATGLSGPVMVTHAPGDFERLFIVEKVGRIKIFRNGVVEPAPFLDISGIVTTDQSQGLHSLAFHPDYQQNGFFYVFFKEAPFIGTLGDSIVARYKVSANPDLADAGSRLTLLRLDTPGQAHPGGWIGFADDGKLWLPIGDGGAAPGNLPQDPGSLFGKVLRIDVDGPDAYPEDIFRNYGIPADNPLVGGPGLGEVFALGLRAPWRCAFDPANGDFYIADVGRDEREELNVLPGTTVGGDNFGWPCMEGTSCPPDLQQGADCVCGEVGLSLPIHEYGHTEGCAIIGGVVYRGCQIPDLQGYYLFADFCSNAIYAVKHDGAQITEIHDLSAALDPPGTPTTTAIGGFGVDAAGEVYICEALGGGDLVKIVPSTSVPFLDCNVNGVQDACDISDGASSDANANEVPDECELLTIPITLVTAQQGSFVGSMSAMSASDDVHAVVADPVLNLQGTRYSGEIWVDFTSPNLTASLINVSTEIGELMGTIKTTKIYLRNWDTGAWTLIGSYGQPAADTVKLFPNVANPNAHVKDNNGKVRMRIVLQQDFANSPAGFQGKIDHLRVEVAP